MNANAFEGLMQPAMPLLGEMDLRAVFDSACADRVDVGSGWDAAAAGQMTLWAFTEAMLRLAEVVAAAPLAAGGGGAARGKEVEEGGLAPALERLVAAVGGG